jgi:16S rRNA (cytidine1402-2'-O)-methyltransferase
MISEAGLPCVADPGSSVVAAAHRSGIQVVPLPGSSSMALALMASGFNGQQFSFHGYLPAETKARNIRIKQIENIALQSGYSQIFIETPYRNDQMIKSLIENCKDTTMLCIACNLTLIEETVISLCIAEWKNINKSFNKQPAVFILSAAG